MSWKRRILELVLAGGTLAATGCGDIVMNQADAGVAQDMEPANYDLHPNSFPDSLSRADEPNDPPPR
jgi:hypothetical protein